MCNGLLEFPFCSLGCITSRADSLAITILYGNIVVGPGEMCTMIAGEQLADMDEKLKKMQRMLTIKSPTGKCVFEAGGEES